MKILFITGLYPQTEVKILNTYSRVGIQNAPNVFQWAVVDGLIKNEAEFEVVSCPFLPSYPLSYKQCFTPSSDIIHNGKKIGKMLSYCDLVGFKTISIKWAIYRYIKNWAERESKHGERLVLLSYTPYPPFLPSIKQIKKKYNLVVATIVTDLVDNIFDFKANRTLLKRFQSLLLVRNTKSLYPDIDKFILLSKHMEEKIPQSKGRSVIIEGIATPRNNIEPKHEIPIRSFLYTGVLETFACVDSLVHAFMRISNPDIRLVICGAGPLSRMIEESAEKDRRIDFRGMVSRKEAIRLQKEATILINPRKPNNGITKYSFPSKTMEYMSSGTPMIGYKLEGIPEEYYLYYYTVEGNDEESLVSTMLNTISLSQETLNRKARLAFDFIQKNKTSMIQVRKMINFLKQ